MVDKIPVYTIDSGVPVPPERVNLMELYPLGRLEIGESIVIPLIHRHKVQNSATNMKSKTGKTFTVRAMGENSARVWRTA